MRRAAASAAALAAEPGDVRFVNGRTAGEAAAPEPPIDFGRWSGFLDWRIGGVVDWCGGGVGLVVAGRGEVFASVLLAGRDGVGDAVAAAAEVDCLRSAAVDFGASTTAGEGDAPAAALNRSESVCSARLYFARCSRSICSRVVSDRESGSGERTGDAERLEFGDTDPNRFRTDSICCCKRASSASSPFEDPISETGARNDETGSARGEDGALPVPDRRDRAATVGVSGSTCSCAGSVGSITTVGRSRFSGTAGSDCPSAALGFSPDNDRRACVGVSGISGPTPPSVETVRWCNSPPAPVTRA